MKTSQQATPLGGATIAGGGGLIAAISSYLATKYGLSPELIALIAGLLASLGSFAVYFVRNSFGKEVAHVVADAIGQKPDSKGESSSN